MKGKGWEERRRNINERKKERGRKKEKKRDGKARHEK
jgi:hypothetical protein